MKHPGEIIRDYVRAFAAHTGCNPPIIEYRFGKYYVTFANGDREQWARKQVAPIYTGMEWSLGMNIKQKMIEAMSEAFGPPEMSRFNIMLDAALSVAADPANWTDGMQRAANEASAALDAEFSAVIYHIKGLPS